MTANLPTVYSMDDMTKMAQAFAQSKMFGAKEPTQVLALLLLAHAEGMHPAIAMRDFDVIQGRPAKKAEAMLRSFIGAGGKVEWHKLDDETADATFSHPQGGSARITWDMNRVRKAQISNQQMYSKYPRQMLRSRCVSEGCRTVYPASTSGMYVPEEQMDIAKEKDITPTAGYLAALPAPRQEVMHETATEIKALWANDQAADAYAMIENSGFDAEELIALWSLLPSDIRSAHKRMKAEETASTKGTISPAKHKRIEAKIKEQLLDRNALKAWCKEQFGVDSFPKLTDEQYAKLDAHIDALPVNQRATVDGNVEVAGDTTEVQSRMKAPDAHAPSPTLSKQQKDEIAALCEMAGININRLLVASKVSSLDEIPEAHFGRCLEWIDKASKKEAK